MERDEAIRELMTKLMEAVEASLATSAEVRDALDELVRNGYEARLFFVANAESTDGASEAGDEAAAAEGSAEADADVAADEGGTYVVREIGAAPEAGEPGLSLTQRDRDFLKSLHIRPETG
jgi:hypothetical protein